MSEPTDFNKFMVQIGWNDAPHLSEDQKAEMLAAMPPHQRDARTKGIPILGRGAVYPVDESEFVCDPFVIPDYMPQCYALDVGWNRTAVLWGAHDQDADILYLYAEHYRGKAEPFEHAQAILARGSWIPGVIDPASRGRGQKDGEQLLAIYQQLLPSLSIANNAVEAGLYAVWIRLTTGRLKVFKTLQNTLSEYRIYRRDDRGHIIKENDHLMDCLRYIVMSGIDVSTIRPPEKWTTGKQAVTGHHYAYDPFSKSEK